MYADLSNVARDIFSIIPHAVQVVASFSLGRDVIGWRPSETAGETLRKKVVVRQFAPSINGIFQIRPSKERGVYPAGYMPGYRIYGRRVRHVMTQHWIRHTQRTTQK